jgi:hypothetical protein
MCAVVRLRALMARQAARLITNPPIRRIHVNTFVSLARIAFTFIHINMFLLHFCL